jgi:hypothetical protein
MWSRQFGVVSQAGKRHTAFGIDTIHGRPARRRQVDVGRAAADHPAADAGGTAGSLDDRLGRGAVCCGIAPLRMPGKPPRCARRAPVPGACASIAGAGMLPLPVTLPIGPAPAVVGGVVGIAPEPKPCGPIWLSPDPPAIVPGERILDRPPPGPPGAKTTNVATRRSRTTLSAFAARRAHWRHSPPMFLQAPCNGLSTTLGAFGTVFFASRSNFVRRSRMSSLLRRVRRRFSSTFD